MQKRNTAYVVLALAALVVGAILVVKAGNAFKAFQESQNENYSELLSD